MSAEPPGTRERDARGNAQMWLGLGLGMVPVVLGWIALGIGLHTSGSGFSTSVTTVSLVSFGLLVLAAIVCLFIRDWRYVGYGMLTMVFVGPIVWGVGCIVILSAGGSG